MLDYENGLMVCDECDRRLDYTYFTIDGYGEHKHYCKCCAEDIADEKFNGNYDCIEEHDDVEELIFEAVNENEYQIWQ